jgi:hypothetical protein
MITRRAGIEPRLPPPPGPAINALYRKARKYRPRTGEEVRLQCEPPLIALVLWNDAERERSRISYVGEDREEVEVWWYWTQLQPLDI